MSCARRSAASRRWRVFRRRRPSRPSSAGSSTPCAASAHLRAIADDVLEGERVNAGAPTIEERELDLAAFLTTFATAADARAQTKGLSFAMRVDGRIAQTILADGRRLRQMLENLVDNAVKVTPAGRIDLAVELLDRRAASTASASRSPTRGRVSRPTRPRSSSAPMAASPTASPAQASAWRWSAVSRAPWAARRDATRRPERAPPSGSRSASSSRLPSPRSRLSLADPRRRRQSRQPHDHGRGSRAFRPCDGRGRLRGGGARLLPSGGFAAVLLDHTLPGMSGLEALKCIRAMSGPLASLP